jgi:uncharacterized protein
MDDIKEILRNYKTVAVVGLSSDPTRASHHVADYLKKQGFRIIPVNPGEKEVLGEKSYPDLASIPEKVDVVDIFRKSEQAAAIVNDAIKIGAKAVWMQEGVIDEAAAAAARQAGLKAVVDRCMLKEHRRLFEEGG